MLQKCLTTTISREEIYNITHFDSKDAMKIGSLITERKIHKPSECIEICLDKSSYEGCVDYEIEVEYTCGDDDEELMNIKELLAKEGITFKNKTKGKFTRFYEKYLENRREDIGVQDSVL